MPKDLRSYGVVDHEVSPSLSSRAQISGALSYTHSRQSNTAENLAAVVNTAMTEAKRKTQKKL